MTFGTLMFLQLGELFQEEFWLHLKNRSKFIVTSALNSILNYFSAMVFGLGFGRPHAFRYGGLIGVFYTLGISYIFPGGFDCLEKLYFFTINLIAIGEYFYLGYGWEKSEND